jgi:hypothetical protein
MDSGSGTRVTIPNTGFPLRVELKWNNQSSAILVGFISKTERTLKVGMEQKLIRTWGEHFVADIFTCRHSHTEAMNK